MIHRVGGQLREEVSKLCRLEGAGSAVDLNDDAGVATETDDVVDVDVDRRQVAQHVERRASLRGRHVAHDERRAIGLDLNLVALRDDRLLLEAGADLGERNPTDVDVGPRRGARRPARFSARIQTPERSRDTDRVRDDTRKAPLVSVSPGRRRAGAAMAIRPAGADGGADRHPPRVRECCLQGRSTARGEWQTEREYRKSTVARSKIRRIGNGASDDWGRGRTNVVMDALHSSECPLPLGDTTHWMA